MARWKMLLCLAVVIAFGVLLVPGVAAAGVYIGDDYYSTIQSAVDAANDGDTLLIEGGEYAEDVVITDKSITLDVYNPGDGVAVTGDGTNDALISIAGTDSVDVTINNLVLDGGGNYQDGVNIDLDVSGSVTLEGNTIENCYAGVYIDDISMVDLTMENNTFEGNQVPVEPLITDPGTNTLNGRVDMFDGDGNPMGITQAIQEAVDRAGDNYTLNVYPWTYREQVFIGKPLQPISMGNRDNTVIDSREDLDALTVSALRAAAPAAPERVKPSGVEKTQREAPAVKEGVQPQHPLRERPQRLDGGAAEPAVFVWGYPVTIQGFEITGLYMEYADGSTIKDNRFTSCDWDGAYLYDTDALWDYNVATEEYEIVQPMLIENNIFTENGWNGLCLDWCWDVTVKNNELSDNGWEGLYTSDADGLVLTGNTFTGNQDCGAWLYDTDNWEDWGDQRAEVTGNTFSDNAYEGLIVDYCYYLPVEDNTISGNGEDGLWLCDDTDYARVIGNTITGSGWDGIYMPWAYGCKVTGNTIQGNGTGNLPYEADPSWVFAGIELYDCWDNEITENTIDGNKDAGLYLAWSGYNRMAKNNITNNGHADNAEFGKGYGGILAGDRYYYGDYYWYYNQVQFNNITGNTPYGLYISGYEEGYWGSAPSAEPPAFFSDSAVGQEVAARIAQYDYWAPFVLNWWGDASGPADEFQGYYVSDQKGNLLGEGQTVMAELWCYDPWLSDTFDAPFPGPGPVLALPVTSGWHLLSTPVALGLNSWQDVVQLGVDLDASVILRYDSVNKEWEVCGQAGTTFDPQDAYFIKLNSGDLLPLVIESNFTSPPTRMLQQGWNLTSLATDDWGMYVRDALASAELTSDGKRGWVQVVKPPFPAGQWGDTSSWACTVNTPYWYYYYMEAFEGYWVYMENADELAGFSTTYPLWEADTEWWYDIAARVLSNE
ncbi:MAG: right-handed parallel beta-helix repeat-containing protein [Bacillota bacterium]